MSLSTNRTSTAFAACAILALGVIAGLQFKHLPGTVDAHEWNGEHWGVNPVGYHDITSNYGANVVSRCINFNAALDNVTLEAQGSSQAEVQIGDADYGATGWAGICRPKSPRWTRWYYVDLNEHYMEGYVGNKRSAVVAHELVHCVGGLTHHNATGVIMQTTIAAFYDRDGVWGIDSITADEIDDLWED